MSSFCSCLKFNEHNVFRLGEKIQERNQNIFEIIEKKGFKVGSVSAMNIFNNLKNPDYFIPDPWTQTKPDDDIWSKILSKSISSIVKDNARRKIDFKNLFYLLFFFLLYYNRFFLFYLFYNILKYHLYY